MTVNPDSTWEIGGGWVVGYIRVAQDFQASVDLRKRVESAETIDG